MSGITTKQIKPPGAPGATSEYALIEDGKEIGRVYRRATSKVGFRYGYCIGRVSTFGWFGHIDGSLELGQGLMGPKWRTRKMAVAGLWAFGLVVRQGDAACKRKALIDEPAP